MTIEFLTLENDRSPVADFILGLDPEAVKRIYNELEKVERYGFAASMSAKKLKKMSGYAKYDLYEIRIKCNNTLYRVFCCIRDSICHLVHIFTKKSRKAPKKEFTTAIQRIIKYLSPSK